jgi:hypothetical protein
MTYLRVRKDVTLLREKAHVYGEGMYMYHVSEGKVGSGYTEAT